MPGCTHPADDRCDACKKAKCACTHPDGERQRCTGSWVVDVRQVRDRKHKGSAVDPAVALKSAVRECAKYACAPAIEQNGEKVGIWSATEDARRARAELVLRFGAAMEGRHRFAFVGKHGLSAVEAEPAPSLAQLARMRCPHCGGRFVPRAVGMWDWTHRRYRWRVCPDPSPPCPATDCASPAPVETDEDRAA